jgi:hypothetical protein
VSRWIEFAVNGEVKNFQLQIHRVGNFIDWNCIFIDDSAFRNGTIGSSLIINDREGIEGNSKKLRKNPYCLSNYLA